jgi:hypothetical protein
VLDGITEQFRKIRLMGVEGDNWVDAQVRAVVRGHLLVIVEDRNSSWGATSRFRDSIVRF